MWLCAAKQCRWQFSVGQVLRHNPYTVGPPRFFKPEKLKHFFECASFPPELGPTCSSWSLSCHTAALMSGTRRWQLVRFSISLGEVWSRSLWCKLWIITPNLVTPPALKRRVGGKLSVPYFTSHIYLSGQHCCHMLGHLKGINEMLSVLNLAADGCFTAVH